MKSITKLEDAYLLPEKSQEYIIGERQPNGSLMYTTCFRDLVAVDSSEDAILLFQDKDGRMMTINYDNEGAYKTPIGVE